MVEIGELKPTKDAPPEATALGLMSNAAAEVIATRGSRPRTSTGFSAGWRSRMPGCSIRRASPR